MKKFNILLFFLLLLSSFVVVAQPPGQVLGDLTIVYPKQDVVALEKNFTAHVHVYNSLNELLNNNDYDCYVHVYDIYGNHEAQEKFINDDNNIDKEWVYNTSVHNDEGWHSYNIFCNTTTETGAVSGSFLSAIGGVDTTNSNNSFTGIFLLLGFGLIAFILILSGAYVNDKKLLGVKLFLWGFGLFHILILSGILMSQSFFNTDISNLLRYNGLLISYFSIVIIGVGYVIYNYIIYYFMDNVMEDGTK